MILIFLYLGKKYILIFLRRMTDNLVTSTSPVYTLSTISSLSGIPVHSIRQYIDRGLIIPFKKESNRHLFSQVDILRLKFIRKLLDEDGLNIAGIRTLLSLVPCWTVRKCSNEVREECQAFHSNPSPCWEASVKGTLCKNSDCRECEVYRVVEKYPDLKSFLKSVIP
jgi:MerR family transcriptional regulator/heat shock protein HspR